MVSLARMSTLGGTSHSQPDIDKAFNISELVKVGGIYFDQATLLDHD
jgi:hypothetical protein